MAVMLPPEVSWLLNALDFNWPEANEDTMYSWGQQWQAYSGTVDRYRAELTAAREHVVGNNLSPSMQAFNAELTKPDDVERLMHVFGTGGQVTGGLLYATAGLVVALKLVVVAQLVSLAIQIASAIAAAPATLGASTAWIPIGKQLTSRLISLALNTVIEIILA